MSNQRRWDRCIHQYGNEVDGFIREHFGESHRRVLLFAGAGFDPRSVAVCRRLATILDNRMRGQFIREERPNPEQELMRRAEKNLDQMRDIVSDCESISLSIFAQDGAVVGGSKITRIADRVRIDDITDIVVDFSALSKGVAFPLVREMLERVEKEAIDCNLHLMVTDEPTIDDEIVATGSDKVGTIHGFKGGWALSRNQKAAKLWLPQLIKKQKSILERIHNFVDPHDVCPILPFPSAYPRTGDELIEHYAEEFDNTWNVDSRNIVYAMENRPLDLYRTILRIDDARRRVFAGLKGSLTILSPIGSKALSIGALMAAIERDFPVVYVEAISYSVNFQQLDRHRCEPGELIHVWLHGDT